MKHFSFSNLLYNLFVCLLIAVAGYAMVGTPAYFIAGFIFLLGFRLDKIPENALHNEVVRRIFSSDLQKNLYPANEFYKNSKVDEGVALNAVSVEIPQAGTPPSVLKNPVVRPIPVRSRKDDKLSYLVDLYETQPDIVTDVNQAIVSYDKRAAILEDHVAVLNQRIANEIMYKWCPTNTNNILRTSGSGNTGKLFTGMTGVRKEITAADIIAIATLMDRMNVPDDGNRCVMLYTDQIAEVKVIPDLKDYDKTGLVGQFRDGAVGKLQNMNVFKRSVPLLASSSGQPKAFGAAVAATDCLIVLAWHPSFVRRAEGVAQVNYSGVTIPGMGGPTMNAAVRGGGCISRIDQVGVIALVQQ